MSETACGSRERDATRRMETPPRAPSTDPSSSHPPTDSAFSEVELRRLEEERKAVRELYVREAEAKRAEKAARERELAAALDTMDRDRRERAEAYRLESLAKKMSLERRADDPKTTATATATATGSTSGSAPAFTPEDLRRLDEERKARQRAYADEARALRRGATRGANTSPSSSNPTTPVSATSPPPFSWSRETREETHPGTRPETTTPVPDPNSDESRPSRPEASPRPEAASPRPEPPASPTRAASRAARDADAAAAADAEFHRQEDAWATLDASDRPVGYGDVPWPPGSSLRVGEGTSSASLEAPWLAVPATATKSRLRRMLLRWHPDKFAARYGGRIVGGEEGERIMSRVRAMSDAVNARWSELGEELRGDG